MGTFISMVDIGILGVASVLCIIFVLLALASRKYESYIEPLDPKEYPLKELYGVGFMILELTKKNFSSKSERERKQKIVLLKGEMHAEYYLMVNAAQRITLGYLIACFGLAAYGLYADIMILVVIIAMGAVITYYYSTAPATELDKKNELIMGEFSDMVTKLTLLVNAGMIMRDAWAKVAYSSEGRLYDEMKQACVDINNGASEVQAYSDFAVRCVSPEVKKFVSTITQGVSKGNSELAIMLKQQNREIMVAKQNRVKQQGAKAASKLLIPIAIMFIGILIMVIVPIFANLGNS